MIRRSFLTLLAAPLFTDKRTIAKIVKEISDGDKKYNDTQKRIVERAKNFEPRTDAVNKGWMREEGDLSRKVGDLWEELADL